MPQQKLVHLAAPVKNFMVPVVSWYPKPPHFEQFQDKYKVTYTVPEPIAIYGKVWYSITAFNANESEMGRILNPLKYYPLWR